VNAAFVAAVANIIDASNYKSASVAGITERIAVFFIVAELLHVLIFAP